MCLPDSYRQFASTAPAGFSITAAEPRPADESVFEHADALERQRERGIDQQLEQSFPASDPPGWTMGVADPNSWRAHDNR